MSAMYLHGVFGYTQLASSLLVQHASDQKRQHLLFSRSQRLVPSEQACALERILSVEPILFQCSFDARQQRRLIDWFRKEVNRSPFHRSDRRWDVPAPSDEDYRNRCLGRDQLLYLQSVQPRHPEIQNQTRTAVIALEVKKVS